jgi:drug/metabolite transporter (DMT)-like permease
MNWVAYASLLFIFSTARYLAVRWSSLKGQPVQFNNLAMFLVGVPVLGCLCLLTHSSLALSLGQLVFMIFIGICLAYLPNATSLKSIELAPNAGYSLIISKSYVVMTTFLAVPLFGAHLSVRALLAIMLIVGFSAVIMLNPASTHHTKSRTWLPLALAAFLGWGFLSLAAKYMFNHGLPTLTFLFYDFLIASICILAEIQRNHEKRWHFRDHLGTFLLIGVLSTSFDIFNFQAIKIAPNVGYVNATNAASIGAVTALSILIFKDELSVRKLIGVLGVIGGLILLFLDS